VHEVNFEILTVLAHSSHIVFVEFDDFSLPKTMFQNSYVDTLVESWINKQNFVTSSDMRFRNFRF